MLSNLRSRRVRTRRGNTIADIGPTLFLVFIIISFPMLAFATLMFRYVWVINAAHLAASTASRGTSWANVKTLAQNTVTYCLSTNKTSGVTLNSTTVSLWTCPPSPATPTKSAGPFTNAGSVSMTGYVFNVEVLVSASISPVVYTKGTWSFVKVPGLTSPVVVGAAAKQVLESTQAAQ